jgi:hypothetical protein
MYNPIIRGWINYYGSYYKSALYRISYQLSHGGQCGNTRITLSRAESGLLLIGSYFARSKATHLQANANGVNGWTIRAR